MAKIFTIGGKDYKIEFSIEASLYEECTEKLLEFMTIIAQSEGVDSIKNNIKGMAGAPNTALTLFYAGLLENHSDVINGKDDAKALFKQWVKEGEGRDFYILLNEMIEQMSIDGFFKLVGVERMLEQTAQISPADHKRKTTKTNKVTKI